MYPFKSIYILSFFGTIVLGLLSRRIDWIPIITGDALYAVMIYWFFRFIFTTKKSYYALIFSVLFCFGIEFLQLLQHPILIEWRNNPMLRLVLGQGFLWTDLIAYCLGSLIAFFIDRKIINRYFK
ncbi:DUF2809 domain-containing protein [Sphingobacterium sp. WQ 366]|uniref:DUF2809 domain-containing protein n=2 Tax=Sphingobacterium bovistauri TaxID=2781959 RepID=A0ABS7ZCX2_9SPHI|nr:DUF2809 domain-containing protein [Sphingobacterium bovistauri]